MRGIAVEERREILTTLSRTERVSEIALAERIATSNRCSSTDAKRTVRTKLVHVHLPLLRAAGLLDWDEDAGTVGITDHPALTDPRFGQLLRMESEELDEVLTGISHLYRRIALTILWSGGNPMQRSSIATEIARYCERTNTLDSVTEEAVTVALHHVHLPKLSDLNLIEYDAESARVSDTNHPVLENVFTILYRPQERVTDKYDGFLSGLRDSYREIEDESGSLADWPPSWSDPHHG